MHIYRHSLNISVTLAESEPGGSDYFAMGSGSESGSGSGAVNTPPTFENCPVSSLNIMAAPETGLFRGNVNDTATTNDDDGNNVTVSVVPGSLIQTFPLTPRLITDVSISNDGSVLEVIINGTALRPLIMNTTQFNVSIIANDGVNDSDVCVLSVLVVYLQAANCPVERSSGEQISPLLRQQENAVIIQLVISEVSTMWFVYYKIKCYRNELHDPD